MPEIQLVITFNPEVGSVVLAASDPNIMRNPILAFGMLETAKLTFIKQLEANEMRVQPATILPPGFPPAR